MVAGVTRTSAIRPYHRDTVIIVLYENPGIGLFVARGAKSHATRRPTDLLVHRQRSGSTPGATVAIHRRHRPRPAPGDQAQRHGGDLRRRQDPGGPDQGVPRRGGRHGCGLVAHPGQRHVQTPPALRRHDPHRGDSGPGGTRAHALRRAQGGAGLRALPRGTGAHPGGQRRHDAFAAVVLLPDHRRRRPRRHLQRHPRQRAAFQVAVGSATTGRRSGPSVPTSRAPTASPKASCRS